MANDEFADGVHRVRSMQRAGDVEGLIHMLASPLMEGELAVRFMAAHGLGKLRAREAVSPLSEMVVGDPSFDVRGRAAWALGRIGDVKALPQLLRAVDDPSWVVRQHVAAALGEIGGSDAEQALVKMVDDDCVHVVDATAIALAKCPVAAAEEPLAARLGDRGWRKERFIRRALRQARRAGDR